MLSIVSTHRQKGLDIGVQSKLEKEGIVMKRIGVGANIAVFLLFFGVATLEAFQTRNWLKAALWLAIGGVFLVADNSRRAT